MLEPREERIVDEEVLRFILRADPQRLRTPASCIERISADSATYSHFFSKFLVTNKYCMPDWMLDVAQCKTLSDSRSLIPSLADRSLLRVFAQIGPRCSTGPLTPHPTKRRGRSTSTTSRCVGQPVSSAGSVGTMSIPHWPISLTAGRSLRRKALGMHSSTWPSAVCATSQISDVGR